MSIISNTIIDLLNFRIQQEEGSARLYLSMSNWLDYIGYTGAAKLWKKYSEEESTHAQWAYQYLLSLSILPVVPVLEAPTKDFVRFTDIINKSLAHEIKITEQCQALANAAVKEGDYMTLQLAERYLKEQVEEIAKTQMWVDKLMEFGDNKTALRLMDNEMGEL